MKGEGAGHLWLVPAEGEGEGTQPKVKGGVTFAVLQKVKGGRVTLGQFSNQGDGGEGSSSLHSWRSRETDGGLKQDISPH